MHQVSKNILLCVILMFVCLRADVIHDVALKKTTKTRIRRLISKSEKVEHQITRTLEHAIQKLHNKHAAVRSLYLTPV